MVYLTGNPFRAVDKIKPPSPSQIKMLERLASGVEIYDGNARWFQRWSDDNSLVRVGIFKALCKKSWVDTVKPDYPRLYRINEAGLKALEKAKKTLDTQP